MTVVYNDHPGWKTIQGLQQLSEVMSRSLERSRARKEERMSRDIEIGIELMKRDPRNASSVGAELSARYGKRVPWLPAAVKMFETEGASLKIGEQAYRGFVDAVGAEAQTREQQFQQAQAQPDAFPISWGPMGGGAARGFQMPNVGKPQAIAQAQANMDPARVADATLQRFDPQQAVLAHNYARAHEDKPYFPTMHSFDRGKLPANAYAIEYQDQLTAPGRDALPVLLGFEEKPATVKNREAVQAYKTQAAQESYERTRALESLRQTNRVTNRLHGHRNDLEMQGLRDANDGSEGGGSGGKLLSQSFPVAHKWVEDRAGGQGTVPAGHVQEIRELATRGAPDSDTANAQFADIAGVYAEMIKDGIDRETAINVVTGRTPKAARFDEELGKWIAQAPVRVGAPVPYSKSRPGFWQRARERVLGQP